MRIKPAYNRLDNWFENRPTMQYVLLSWLLAFSITALILIVLIGDDRITTAMSAAGSATGVAVGMYLLKRTNS